MELTTDRLILRRATREDAPFVLHLLNSPGWMEFIGDRNIRNLDDAIAYIETALEESFTEFGFGLMIMEKKTDGLQVGLCGLLKRQFFDSPDLGFAIAPEFVRQGYTFEAAQKVLSYANETLHIDRVIAFTNEKNIASQNLLLKLGMELIEKKQLKSYNEVSWIYRQQG